MEWVKGRHHVVPFLLGAMHLFLGYLIELQIVVRSTFLTVINISGQLAQSTG
jgi:hypothetical protein